jgi:hypothetical protein
MSTVDKSIDMQSWLVIISGRGEKQIGSDCFGGYMVPLWGDENILEVNRIFTTLWI